MVDFSSPEVLDSLLWLSLDMLADELLEEAEECDSEEETTWAMLEPDTCGLGWLPFNTPDKIAHKAIIIAIKKTIAASTSANRLFFIRSLLIKCSYLYVTNNQAESQIFRNCNRIS